MNRLAEAAARIGLSNAEIATKAVWLIKGRPGYIVTKEDADGKKED